jgi:phage terminase large subunit-like protein
MGLSVDVEFIERGYKQAVEDGEESFRGFLAKHLNVEIGLALRSDRWAGADYWERQAVAAFSLADLIDQCEVLDAGIDGGGLDDLLGFAVIGRRRSDRKWMVWAHAWAHPIVLERRKDVAPRLMDFAKAKHLTVVKRVQDDVQAIADLCMQLEQSGRLDKIGVDPSGLGGILDAMLEAGVPEEKIIGVSQGWKMTGAIKTAERKLAEGVMVHGGQPMLAWCISNAKVEPRGNAVIITKQASGSAKIDPLMAMLNAVSLMALNPGAAAKSFWESDEEIA